MIALHTNSTAQVPNQSIFSHEESKSSVVFMEQRNNQWGERIGLVVILLLALIIRLTYVSGIGLYSDLDLNSSWSQRVVQNGLFSLYKSTPPDYPPIYMALLGAVGSLESNSGGKLDVLTNTAWVQKLKLFPVAADLLLIVVVYLFLRSVLGHKNPFHRNSLLKWAILGVLALAPGIFADSAWWGQTDSLLTLLLILALIALNRDQPLIAWVVFAIAITTKFQAIGLLPLLVVVTLRRYGMIRLILCASLAAVVAGVILLPFLVESGLSNTLRPYLGSVDIYPVLSANAYNTWHLIANGTTQPDNLSLFGPITAKQIGLLVFAAYVLVWCIDLWKDGGRGREFIAAAALYLGFFMLPTQIHERYLYMGAVLALIAIAQGQRLWWIALGFILTLTWNILNVAEPLTFLGWTSWHRTATVPIAVINVILFIDYNYHTSRLFAALRISPTTVRRLLKVTRLVGVLACLVLFFATQIETALNRQTANWMLDHVSDSSHLAYDQSAQEIVALTHDSPSGQTWIWQRQQWVDQKSTGTWIAQGVHYLLVDEHANSFSLDSRLQKIINGNAAPLYESRKVLNVGSRFVFLWTFRPQVELNDTFDSRLTLIGYNVTRNEQGVPTGLLMHWYTHSSTPTGMDTALPDYTYFVHRIDSTGKLLGQADVPLGLGSHPSSTWRHNEIVFETINIPDLSNNALKADTTQAIELQIGLYQASNGTRAQIVKADGTVVGDTLSIEIK